MEFPTVNALILVLVTFIVTQGLKALAQLLKVDLSGNTAAITAGMVGLLITLFNTVLLPLIPSAAIPVIEPTAAALIAILGAFGVHYTIKSIVYRK